MEIDKLTIRNFKCFDEVGASIETLKSINVIIGKNNSGKSSVIDIFKFLTTNDNSFFKNGRNGKQPELEFEHIVNDHLIRETFSNSTSGGGIPGNSHQQYGLTLVGSILHYITRENAQNHFKDIERDFNQAARHYIENYVSRIVFPLKGKQFSHLSAERDI